MQQTQSHDLLLIQKFQSGNKSAFDELVMKYQYRILKLITRYIKDHDESLDLMQESFIKAYKGLDNFKYQSSFYTWLYKIAINTAKTHLIDKNRYLSSFSFDVLENDQLNYMIKDLYKDKDFNIAYNLINCEELENMFFDIIKNLPIELKTTIFLREIDELTYEEIASIMECPLGTVRSRIFRARDAIEKNIVING